MNWEKPVFIVCCTNSGSKLLQTILNESEELSLFPAEAHYIGFGPNLNGRINRLFGLWPCFDGSFAQSQNDPPSFEKGPLGRDVFIQGIEQVAQLRFPHVDHNKRVIIKEPKFSLRILWLLDMFPDARIITLYRNPFSVCEGIRRRLPYIGDLPLSIDIPTCCSQWMITTTNMLMHLNHPNIIPLRFEDLLDNTDGEIKKICEKLQINAISPKTEIKNDLALKSFENLSRWEITFIYEMTFGTRDRLGYDSHFVKNATDKIGGTYI